MKRFILMTAVLLSVFGLCLGGSPASAQPFPNRPVNVVVPGARMLDTSCRIFTEEWGKNLGTQCIVLNKPGASLTLGTDFVARGKKDGYTLLYTATAPLLIPKIFKPKTISYNWEKDLDPLGGRALFPFTLVVQETSPWKTFGEFIDQAKKRPGELRIGTPGVETVSNFDLEIIQSQTGAQFTHVPIQDGPAISLLGGHIEGAIIPITEVIAHVEAKKLRILLFSNPMPDFPKVPTLRGRVYKQDILLTWFVFYAPSGIPEEARKVLVPTLKKTVETPEVKSRIEKLSFICEYINPVDMKKEILDEYQTISAIADRLGLRK